MANTKQWRFHHLTNNSFLKSRQEDKAGFKVFKHEITRGVNWNYSQK